MKTQAIIYTRFSPQRDGAEKESCATQADTCRQYAEMKKYEVTAVFNDPEASGADEYREKLWQAIRAVPRDGVLIVYKRDRLARNVYLSEQVNRAVRKRGGRIEAVAGDIAGDGPEITMIRQVLASIAEYERMLIASRTSHAMKWHMRQGKRMSRYAPYGWQMDPDAPKRMMPLPEEAAVVERIWAWGAEGVAPVEICNRLNAEKIRARGDKWRSKVVIKILGRAPTAVQRGDDRGQYGTGREA